MSTISEPQGTEKPETARDWLVVATSFVGTFVSVLYLYGTGAFMLPLEAEFGWSRTITSSGLTLISVVAIIAAPLVGYVIDRFGSRRIALLGICIFSAAFAGLSTATGSVWNWWLLWVFVALGTILIKPVVWISAITTRFDRRRGLAMGIALCGTGVAAAVQPFIATLLIQSVGWQAAYVILGAGGALLALPLLLLFFHDGGKHEKAKQGEVEDLPGLSVRQGLRSPVFYKLAFSSMLTAGGVLGLVVHFVPIMVAGGLDAAGAAAIAGIVGVTSIIGRIGTGWLLDRFPGWLVGGIGNGIPILACAILLLSEGSVVGGALAAAIIGFSVGAELDIAAYLSSRHFGRRNYALLFGTLAGMISLGIGVGAVSLGAMYDFFGSYEQVLWSLMPLFALCSLLVFSTGNYPESLPYGDDAPAPQPAAT